MMIATSIPSSFKTRTFTFWIVSGTRTQSFTAWLRRIYVPPWEKDYLLQEKLCLLATAQ